MKRLFIIIALIFIHPAARSQASMENVISKSCDSIFALLVTEKQESKKVDLIIKFYLTSVDGFPVLLLSLGQRLLAAGEQKKDIIIESAGWSALGQGHRLTGNHAKALEMHRKAVGLAERTGNYQLMSFAVNQMGHIYKDRLENDKALELYKTALQYARQTKGAGMWFPAMNLATVYLNMGQLDSSGQYADVALKQVGNHTILSNHAVIAFTIATIHSKRGDSIKARKYYDEAIDIAVKSRSPRYLNSSYVALAEHFHLLKQYDSAAWYCRKAVEAVQHTASANLALKPARMLIDYYQDKNADSTVKFWKLYAVANDSLNNTKANQQIQMITFEEEQRKRDIETENLKYRNKIRTGMLLGGLALFSLAALLLFRNNRQKQKANITLQKTLEELQHTQKQLIQSEKMASLGELTAGIAHEIQNPLNFVNNFSEVSNELVDEMNAEMEKGELREAKAIAADIKRNLEKINHHGKRADAIVKGMLQHSQNSKGQKEPTGINALCDEYLRLSYHGLRAKDKFFNATLKTDFDESIGKITIVPQDIGRVIMNLLNNALYAVAEKKRDYRAEPAEAGDNFDPAVSISTKKIKDRIEIRVSDNGNGIPQPVINKIFQPFFTTKPTGQGTGLGLSLAYDIIKAHEGDIHVISRENGGTDFIITLPTH